MTKIKPNSWEHYLHLIITHDWDFIKTDKTKQWIIEKHRQEEKDIERLRLQYDVRNEMYNQYSNVKK